jgi:hypothetical protein
LQRIDVAPNLLVEEQLGTHVFLVLETEVRHLFLAAERNNSPLTWRLLNSPKILG